MNRLRAALPAAAAAMVAALVVLIPAAPASADASVTVTITAPGSGSASGSSVVTISGDGAITQNPLGLTTNTITGVSIQVHGAGSASCAGGCGGALGQPTTHFSFAPFLAYNGHYTADVVVNGQEPPVLGLGGQSHSQSASVSFKVGAPPAAPHGLKTVVNSDRTVTVTWAANSEPDIVGYQVQRTDSGGPRSGLIAKGSTLTWTDTDAQANQSAGQYQYVVYAARTGADPGTANWISKGSGTVGADVPAPPPPPPTTLPLDGSQPPLVQATPTTAGSSGAKPVGPTLDLSGFLPKTAGGGAPAKLVTPGVARPVTPAGPGEIDTGFQPTLPFPVTAGHPGKPGSGIAGSALGGQAAGSSHSTTRRTILLPFAAGLFLCVVGIHVRWFNNRFGGDGTDPALLPVEDVPTGDGDGGGSSGGGSSAGGDILPARATRPARPAAAAAAAAATTPLDDENVLVTW